MTKRRIISAVPSPLHLTDKPRWKLTLECGHELYETNTKRPRLEAQRVCNLCGMPPKKPVGAA
jgi:hypothetical protein